ncbi:MAG TPA: penicillin-binding transpeptidase domain-containing protein [Amycolatopsis sp.]|nr:penicillin-binding transpeptidase domain-containing protein [Amycolatopsis sp.]
MNPGRRRAILIGAALGVVAIVVGAVVVLNSGGDTPPAEAGPATETGPVAGSPTSAAQEYIQDVAEGNTDAASRLTDDPAGAGVALRDARNTLLPSKVTTSLTKVDPTPAGGTKAGGVFSISWTLKPTKVWTYDVPFQVALSGSNWRMHWTPALLHPKLEQGQRLVIATGSQDAPAVVDRDGKPLVVSGPGGTRPAVGNPAPMLRDALTAQSPTAKSDGFAVQRVDASGKSLETMFGQTSSDSAKPVTASLSLAAQKSAQSAVDGYPGAAIVVAIQPSSGDILAVAQNAAAGNSPKAFSGLYAPGSSFKIATSVAALEAGLVTVNSSVDCPLSKQIGTRTVRNEDFELGTTTLHKAFAKSCNTTFGQLASELDANGLKNAADQLGLNADFEIPGISTELGKVDPAPGNDLRVEEGFGQGDLKVSPLGGAVMAATVAAGKPVTPKLFHGVDTTVVKGYSAPPASILAQVRTMMREVVTGGTATAAASAGQVFGKTGTAQFGDGTEASGWFVGYRGDVAFAVVLEKSNDSKPAVQLAAKFLNGL